MHIYESHMGGFYATDEPVDEDFLYCEQCGDFDWYVGDADSREEAFDLLIDYMDLFDPSLCDGCSHSDDYDYCDNECENFSLRGDYSRDYVLDFINEHWDE